MLAIAVSETGNPAVAMRAFRKEHGLTYPLVSDQTGSVAKRFDVSLIPANIVLDRRHRVVAFADDVDKIKVALKRLAGK